MALVYFNFTLDPIPKGPPVQPVLISHTFTSCSSIFLPKRVAYRVGCKGRNASPKQAEKVACGSSIPTSVPATFAVYPEMKWYMAWLVFNLEMGGKIPKASAVRKNMFLGGFPMDGEAEF